MLYRDIEELEDDLDHAKRTYLRRWGWEYTCNTPGSYWMWKRDFAEEDAAASARHEARKPTTASPPKPYGVITADTDLAISMTTSFLDERKEDEGEGDE